jgi:hypothetical protein
MQCPHTAPWDDIFGKWVLQSHAEAPIDDSDGQEDNVDDDEDAAAGRLVWEEVMTTTTRGVVDRASVRELIHSMALLPPRAKAWRIDLSHSKSKLASLVDVLFVAFYPTTTPVSPGERQRLEQGDEEALDTVLALAVLSRLAQDSQPIADLADDDHDEGELVDD